MGKAKLLPMIAASVVLLPACDRAGHRTDSEAAQANPAAAEQSIRAEIERWKGLIRAKDAAGIAGLYAEDGVLMAPNAPAATGRAAIQQAWQTMLSTPGFELNIEPQADHVAKAGDLAVETGSYRFTATLPAGPFAENGKYVVVWRNAGGQWRAWRDIFNSDSPPPGG